MNKLSIERLKEISAADLWLGRGEAKAMADELIAIRALKGEQVPVYQMYYNGFWRDVDKEHYEHFKGKGSDVRVLFTASQNLVVRPRLEPCLKQVQFERDCEWIEAIKAAGGIVAGHNDKVDITCWSCRRFITFQQHAEADGFCPHCSVEIELDDKDGE